MVGDHVMTQHECMGERIVADAVALASFGLDSHVVQYFVNEKGFVRREGVTRRRLPQPYGVSYRSIVPRRGECDNLFVPVCLSASHTAHGSIRMEPVAARRRGLPHQRRRDGGFRDSLHRRT
jgi:hypothetical protein